MLCARLSSDSTSVWKPKLLSNVRRYTSTELGHQTFFFIIILSSFLFFIHPTFPSFLFFFFLLYASSHLLYTVKKEIFGVEGEGDGFLTSVADVFYLLCPVALRVFENSLRDVSRGLGIHQKPATKKNKVSRRVLLFLSFQSFAHYMLPLLPSSGMDVLILLFCFPLFDSLDFLFCFLLIPCPLMSAHVHIIPTDIRIKIQG